MRVQIQIKEMVDVGSNVRLSENTAFVGMDPVSARELADDIFCDLMARYSLNEISFNELIDSVRKLDSTLSRLFGNEVISPGKFSCFYLCKCARMVCFGDTVMHDCGACVYLIVCSQTQGNFDVEEIENRSAEGNAPLSADQG